MPESFVLLLFYTVVLITLIYSTAPVSMLIVKLLSGVFISVQIKPKAILNDPDGFTAFKLLNCAYTLSGISSSPAK